MTNFLITSSISLLVFLGFYQLVLEREKIHRFNRFYLLVAIVISLAIPFLNFEIVKIVPVVQNTDSLPTVTTASLPETEVLQNPTIPVQTVNYIPYILWGLYGAMALVLLFRFGKNCFRLILKSKSNPVVKYHKAHLILIAEKTLPHTFLNAIFINSEDYLNQNIEDELYAHELVHVNQKHTLDILFIELLKAVFWFNPVFYFYKRAIQLNHEFLADDAIVKTYDDIPFYQNLLLRKANHQQTIYLASNLNYSVTKKRLLMMTKSTSKRIALLKKVAIVPVIAGLIYFFCFEVVAQEKIMGTYSNNENSELTDKDKIRDRYYANVRILLNDLRSKTAINKMYEELTLEEKRTYLNWVPDRIIEKEIPEPLFEKMKTQNMAVWIDGKTSSKAAIQKYKRTDFSYYSCSFVHKNARTKRFPQAYQYTLYTKKYFDENLKNSHLHFKNDTLKMTVSETKKEWKKVTKLLNTTTKKVADTIVWVTKEKEGYNLYVNNKKEKKTIVIDVGHGGQDFGATKEDWNEKNLTLEIAKKIEAMHAAADVTLLYTRTEDEFIDLKGRTNFINANKPDLVISLHVNNNKNTDANGFEIFVTEKTDLLDETKLLAAKLSSKLAQTPLRNRGLKTAPFWILRNSDCPSMVVELGFISNENDREFISSEKGQTEIAKNIVAFLSEVK